MKENILSALKHRRLIFDGATGTELKKRGVLSDSDLPEKLNFTNPDAVIRLHEEYLSAGADIIKTNTFGVNPIKYENYADYIKKGIENAAVAAKIRSDAYIAFDMGPLGSMLEPLGKMKFEDAVDAYYRNALAAKDTGVDFVLLETFTDTYELKAAVLGVKEACDLPIFATVVFDGTHKLLTGASVDAVVCLLEGLGVSALGMNCSLGPDKMLEILPEFVNISSLPVIVNPNAGLPSVRDGETFYDVDEYHFAEYAAKMAECGAAMLGGCCGTSPKYIEKIVEYTKNIDYTPNRVKNYTLVSSYTHAVRIGEEPKIIGERINPTGKPKLKEALRARDYEYIYSLALSQEEAGADILDSNVGLPEIDEEAVMADVIKGIQAVSDLPLSIDTPSPKVLERAMRLYNGKPLINSVNGSEKSMRAVFPLVKKYGGVCIALAMDEEGIPETAQGRVKIIERIIECAQNYGIDRKDIIADALTMSVSSSPSAANVTLEAVRMLNGKGINTTLGVSNVSFGLPARETLNAAFFLSALQNGLSVGIINPSSVPMMNSFYSYRALRGIDKDFNDYIAYQSKNTAAPEQIQTQKTAKAEERSLYSEIVNGMRDRAVLEAGLLSETTEPLDIINQHIIPALDCVGRDFESGKIFLPKLLRSAECATAAFNEIKSKISKQKQSAKGEIILATVEGDIHDIGKNIVKVMLESYGYTVIDLGKNVPKEVVVQKIIDTGCTLVGLSALMTTTVGSMEETIKLIRQRGLSAKVMVGGAVLNAEYAQMIGADYYGCDAMESVKIAKEHFESLTAK